MQNYPFRTKNRAGAQRSGSERRRRAMTLVEYRACTICNIVSCGKEPVCTFKTEHRFLSAISGLVNTEPALDQAFG